MIISFKFIHFAKARLPPTSAYTYLHEGFQLSPLKLVSPNSI